MFNAVCRKCQDYYNEIPNDTLPKVVKSAFYTFTATLLWNTRGILAGANANLAHPLFAAGVASLASLIYALTTPIFNEAFGSNHILFHREFIKQVFVTSTVSIIVHCLTASKVNLFAITLLSGICINQLLGLFESVPSLLEWNGQSVEANQVRGFYKSIGIDALPGSSTIFFSVGLGCGYIYS